MTAKTDTPLSRYARILETVGAANEGITLSNIARAAGLQVGTAHRLVNSLRDVGLLEQADGSRSYVLGPRLLRLLHVVALPSAVVSVARPFLRELVAEFGETVFIARLAGSVVETVTLEQPMGDFRSYIHPGREMPMHATATGKAILAFQDPDFIDRILAEPRVRFTENTCVEEAALRAQLAEVRETGFAVCDNEMDVGALSYACPLKLDGRHVFYALGIVGFADRMREVPAEQVRRAIARTAEAMSERATEMAA